MTGRSRSFPWPRLLRRPRRRISTAREHAALAPALTQQRQWQTSHRQLPLDNRLYRIFAGKKNAGKWVHYFDIYESVLAPFRERPVTMLEIGIHKGGSLRMWRDYFPSGSRIVGIDLDPACAAHDDPDSDIFVRIGAQQDERFLRALVDELGPFDIVIDDGSHMASHIIKSFNMLFAVGMTARSVYIVEDLHTNYHPAFADGPWRFLDIVKHLIDLMHAHYEDMHRRPSAAFESTGSPASFSVPAITTILDQIQIYDSLVVLHRRENRQTPIAQASKTAARELATTPRP